MDCPANNAGFKDGESEDVERFVGMPAELGAIDPNEEDAVGNLRTANRGQFRRGQGLGVSCDHLLFGCE